MGSFWLHGALALALLFRLSHQQRDPLKDFCRRFGHQTAVVDRKLYIDGGLLNWNPIESNPLNYTNTWLLYADLDIIKADMPREYANLTKGPAVPSVHGGMLWPDTVNKMLYLYGGEYYQTSPDSFTLWAYDTINDEWSAASTETSQISRVSFGAGVAVQDIARAYHYGGWLSNASVPGWAGPPMATSSLIIYDMIENAWRNTTGPDSIPRAEGAMVYLPVSDRGMLVYFGGIQTPYGPGNNTAVGVPMNQILLYDIASRKWYTQNATGDVPDMRRRFCAGVTWAKDRSSYNIYLYGGASMPPLTVGFDDVYILTMPSFTWIKWFPTEPGSSYPHHSLTCDVIDNSQMIIMGGTFPNTTSCDNPEGYGMHNLNLGKQNSEGAKWYPFQPNLTSYKVPSEIIATVGGGGDGGATLKAPTQGWNDRDLPVYFTRPYTQATRTPTRSLPASAATATRSPDQDSDSPNTAAIAGGAAGGGVVLIICIAACCWLCIRARKKKRQGAQELAAPTVVPELANQQDPAVSPHSNYTEPYKPSTSPLAAPENHGQPYYGNVPQGWQGPQVSPPLAQSNVQQGWLAPQGSPPLPQSNVPQGWIAPQGSPPLTQSNSPPPAVSVYPGQVQPHPSQLQMQTVYSQPQQWQQPHPAFPASQYYDLSPTSNRGLPGAGNTLGGHHGPSGSMAQIQNDAFLHARGQDQSLPEKDTPAYQEPTTPQTLQSSPDVERRAHVSPSRATSWSFGDE